MAATNAGELASLAEGSYRQQIPHLFLEDDCVDIREILEPLQYLQHGL